VEEPAWRRCQIPVGTVANASSAAPGGDGDVGRLDSESLDLTDLRDNQAKSGSSGLIGHRTRDRHLSHRYILGRNERPTKERESTQASGASPPGRCAIRWTHAYIYLPYASIGGPKSPLTPPRRHGAPTAYKQRVEPLLHSAVSTIMIQQEDFDKDVRNSWALT
jgi:hypothetical protein